MRRPSLSPDDPRAVLARALARLQERAASLEQRLETGDESAWSSYCEAIEALAVVADRTAPGSHGELLTTAEMATRLGVAPKTLLKHKARGQVRPALQTGKLIRWRGDEATR
jgi:hypothetical protein